jgi:hypothetical protein
MAYCTAAEVKTYGGVSGSGDDTLIGDLIDRAQKVIEVYTDRVFEASSDTTRTFTVGEDTDGRTLWFDEDCAAITTITNKADASTTEDVATTEYVTLPHNRTPYYGVRLLSSSSIAWDYDSAPENGITVTGKWAYSTTAPNDIKHACIRLSAYYYRQKDAQVFDVVAVPDAGIITIPQGIPADVKLILNPYVKAI